GVVFGLDEVDDAAPAEIGVAEDERFLRRGVVRAVEAPIADEQVRQAVAVEIASGNAGPEAGEVVERGASSVERDGRVPGREFAGIVFEDADGAPVTSEDEFGSAVAVEIAPDGA